MTIDRLRVFVSSKMQELAPERREMKASLDELQVDAWVFEKDAGARAGSIQQTYLGEVENADLYIGVFWKGHGDYTIEEFEHARKLGKDCLVYEKREDLDQRDAKLKEFLDRIGRVETGLTVQWFHTPEELGEFVKRDVARWQAEIVRRHARSANVMAGTKATVDRIAPRELADITKAPYKFLSYYDIGDRDIFFGRDAVIEELAGEIPRHKVLIINGQSGSGKTSLINAGLIPRLAENGYLYVYFRDYSNPLEQLREYFRDHPDFALPDADKLTLLQILRAIRSQQESPVVVIFDQFERFLINVAAEPRREFLQQLHECLESDLTADELNLVISLRDDFYGKLLLEAEAIIPTFGTDSHHHNLRTLNRDEARQAIIQPLKNIPNIGFDGKFVDDVLLPHLMGASCAQGQSVQPETKIEPPHLQIVCNQLYDAARDRYRQQLEDGEPIRIGFDLYHDLGETEGMLRDYLEDVIRRITNGDAKQISIVRSALKLMIETVGTRKFESIDDISADLPDVPPSETEAIITKLQEARVLEAKQSGNETEFSLSHEFMVAKVESWYDEREIERKRAEETFERALKEWKSHSTVLDEAQLKLISEWLPADTLGDDGLGLVVASKTRHMRQRWLKRGLLIAMVTCVILMPIAVIGWSTAQSETTRANQEAAKAEKNRDLAKKKEEEERKQRIRAEEQTELAERRAERLRRGVFAAQLLSVASTYETNPTRALEFLEDTNKCPLDLRDFTWRYFHKLCNRNLFTFTNESGFNDAAFTPDGASMIGGTAGGELVILDLSTGETLASFSGHDGEINAVAISPDGQIVATAGEDAVIHLWTPSKREKLASLRGHEHIIKALAFSPDGKLLASGGYDKTLRIWDISKQQERFVVEAHAETVDVVAFSPDGKYLVSADEESIRIWDPSTSQPLHAIDYSATVEVGALAFTPDGSTFGTSNASLFGNSASFWDAKTGKPIMELNSGRDSLQSLAISPDGKTLATGTFTGATIAIWDWPSGKLRYSFSARRSGVGTIRFSPDGSTFASIGGGIQIWAVEPTVTLRDSFAKHIIEEPFSSRNSSWLSGDGTQLLYELGPGDIVLIDVTKNEKIRAWQLGEEFLSTVGFPPDGKHLAIAATSAKEPWNDTLTFLQTSDNETMWERSIDGHVNTVAFSRKGDKFATNTGSETIVWKAGSGTAIAKLPIENGYGAQAVVFSADGRSLAAIDDYGNVSLWGGQSWQKLADSEHGDGRVGTCVAFSPDGETLASASFRKIELWDVSPFRLRERLVAHVGSVSSLAFSPDGATLFSVGDDDIVKLWDPVNGHERATFSPGTQIGGLAVASDSSRVTVLGPDRTAYNFIASQQLPPATISLLEPVNAVDVSPDGSLFVAGIGDMFNEGIIQIWDGKTGQSVATLENQPLGVRDVKISQDGRHLATTSAGSGAPTLVEKEPIYANVRVWKLDTRELVDQVSIEYDDIDHPPYVAFRPDSQLVAIGSGEVVLFVDGRVERRGKITLRDFIKREDVWEELCDSPVVGIDFNQSGELLATAEGRELQIRNTANRKLIARLRVDADTINSIAFSKAADIIASGNSDGTVTLWRGNGWKEVSSIQADKSSVNKIAFSSDGRLLATTGSSGQVRVWRVDTGEMVTELVGHFAPANALSFFPNSRSILSSCRLDRGDNGIIEAELKIWQLSQ